MAALDATISGADGVIEYHDLRCAGLVLDQRFDLGLPGAADLVLVEEVTYLGLVRRQDEGLAVERQVPDQGPRIVDAHLEVAVVALASCHAGTDRRIVGDRLDAEVGEVGNGSLDPRGEWRD